MSYLSASELESIGFKCIGKNVAISNKASFYNPNLISIGDNSRIDDFCILSAGEGGITIGKYVHISCYCCLIGKEAILLQDYSGLSSRVTIYSSSDDYSGLFMTNPTVDRQFTNVQHKPVEIGKHAIVGAGSVLLPGVIINTGAAVGALSLVTKTVKAFTIVRGSPAVFLKNRSKKLLELEENFNKSSMLKL
jgi:galactoside O-acetyltransferase